MLKRRTGLDIIAIPRPVLVERVPGKAMNIPPKALADNAHTSSSQTDNGSQASYDPAQEETNEGDVADSVSDRSTFPPPPQQESWEIWEEEELRQNRGRDSDIRSTPSPTTPSIDSTPQGRYFPPYVPQVRRVGGMAPPPPHWRPGARPPVTAQLHTPPPFRFRRFETPRLPQADNASSQATAPEEVSHFFESSPARPPVVTSADGDVFAAAAANTSRPTTLAPATAPTPAAVRESIEGWGSHIPPSEVETPSRPSYRASLHDLDSPFRRKPVSAARRREASLLLRGLAPSTAAPNGGNRGGEPSSGPGASTQMPIVIVDSPPAAATAGRPAAQSRQPQVHPPPYVSWMHRRRALALGRLQSSSSGPQHEQNSAAADAAQSHNARSRVPQPFPNLSGFRYEHA